MESEHFKQSTVTYKTSDTRRKISPRSTTSRGRIFPRYPYPNFILLKIKNFLANTVRATMSRRRNQPDSRVLTKFLLVADTQDVSPAQRYEDSPFRKPLPPCDVFIHAGDMTSFGGVKEYEECMRWIKKDVQAEVKILIAGNRDPALDTDFLEKKRDHHRYAGFLPIADECYNLLTNQDALNHNIFYLENEAMTFDLSNGATFTIFASPYSQSRPNGAGAFQYRETDPSPYDDLEIPDHVDIVVTHGPARRILDRSNKSGIHAGCKKIKTLVKELRPLLHVCGHIHEEHGHMFKNWESGESWSFRQTRTISRKIRAGEETLFVNAAIVGIEEEQHYAVHGETIVELELPRTAA